jgi:hypothetical protein
VSDLRRTNISIRESLYEKARDLMQIRDFDNFSAFLEQLIREEHERRHGPAQLRDQPAPTPPSPVRTGGGAPGGSASAPSVSYKTGTRRRKHKPAPPFGKG